MSNEFLDYIEDIIDAMDKAQTVLDGVSYKVFSEDFRINFVVVRALEIVGEATKRLPMSLRDEYPDVPWREMAGMRDRIIHGYDVVDLRIVWNTVKDRIPVVRKQIQQILDEYED